MKFVITMTKLIILTITIAILVGFAILPTQLANADLTSTSPETVTTATATGNNVATSVDAGPHPFHCTTPGPFGCFTGHTDHTLQTIWSLTSVVVTSTSISEYELNVKSLKDFTVNLSGDLNDGTTVGLTYSDATSTGISPGGNTLTPASKGIATISISSNVAANAATALQATTPPNSLPFLCHPGIFGGGCPHSVFAINPASATSSDDVTLTIVQPNAGGPKPRLSQESGANLLGFSSITLFMKLPANGTSLVVSAPGATTCEVFDSRNTSQGLCSDGPIVYKKGLWSVIADGAASATTTISAIVDGIQSLDLLTAAEKT